MSSSQLFIETCMAYSIPGMYIQQLFALIMFQTMHSYMVQESLCIQSMYPGSNSVTQLAILNVNLNCHTTHRKYHTATHKCLSSLSLNTS